MELYLLRHGASEGSAESGKDFDRRLIPPGVTAVTEVITQARQAGLNPSLIIASPYVRALETARLAARLLEHREDILTSTALTPESDPESAWSEIRTYDQHPSILAVTHEPLVSAAVSWILGTSRLVIEFSPAAIARIDVDRVIARPRGVLRWSIIPERP